MQTVVGARGQANGITGASHLGDDDDRSPIVDAVHAADPYDDLADAACACCSAQLCVRHLRELPGLDPADRARRQQAAEHAAARAQERYLALRRRLVGC